MAVSHLRKASFQQCSHCQFRCTSVQHCFVTAIRFFRTHPNSHTLCFVNRADVLFFATGAPTTLIFDGETGGKANLLNRRKRNGQFFSHAVRKTPIFGLYLNCIRVYNLPWMANVTSLVCCLLIVPRRNSRTSAEPTISKNSALRIQKTAPGKSRSLPTFTIFEKMKNLNTMDRRCGQYRPC